ncbi:Scytalone dehydratase [Trichoderma sp. SZMC 28013]
MATDISIQDYLSINNLAFEWAESYDTKDWGRLKESLAPSIRLDFSYLRGEKHENLTPESYSTILIGMIGDKRLKTQHLLGRGQWELQKDGVVRVAWQIRAAHIRYADETLAEVTNHGHGHGVTTHWYKKVDGVWKIEGVAPRLDFQEYDLFGTLTAPEAVKN